MGWLIDPVEEKAEIELKDSKKPKSSNKTENPLKEKAFIVVSQKKKLTSPAPFLYCEHHNESTIFELFLSM